VSTVESGVAAAGAVFAKSVLSEPHRRATEAEGSSASALRLRAGSAAADAPSAGPAVGEAVADVLAAPVAGFPCRANQVARGVAAESLGRFCLMWSISPP